MKKFLMQSASNKAWIASQEKLHSDQLQSEQASQAMRQQLFPELSLARVQTIERSQNANDILLQAQQRQKFKHVLAELLTLSMNRDDHRSIGKKQETKDLFKHGILKH